MQLTTTNVLGFQFEEEMSGVWFETENKNQRPFKFRIRSINPSLRQFLTDGRMSCFGSVQLDGSTREILCQGTLIMPVRSRYVHIELNFDSNGEKFLYKAHKKLSLIRPLYAITTFKGHLYKNGDAITGENLGEVVTRFNLRRDLFNLLRSIKFRNIQ